MGVDVVVSIEGYGAVKIVLKRLLFYILFINNNEKFILRRKMQQKT